MNSQIAMWYTIMGLLTCIIAITRSLRNKQSLPPDELTSLSWFILWWIWLPLLLWRLIQTKIFKKD